MLAQTASTARLRPPAQSLDDLHERPKSFRRPAQGRHLDVARGLSTAVVNLPLLGDVAYGRRLARARSLASVVDVVDDRSHRVAWSAVKPCSSIDLLWRSSLLTWLFAQVVSDVCGERFCVATISA